MCDRVNVDVWRWMERRQVDPNMGHGVDWVGRARYPLARTSVDPRQSYTAGLSHQLNSDIFNRRFGHLPGVRRWRWDYSGY